MMKKYLYMAVAAIAALSSCQSDDIVSDENGKGNTNEVNAPVFTATIENAGTRTQLATGSSDNTMKVEWLSTDQVYVLGFNRRDNQASVLGVYTAAPSNDNAAEATLTPSTLKINNPEVTATEYYAVYPASISALSAVPDGILQSAPGSILGGEDGMQKINLPSTQTYNGTNISQIAPMYAYTTTTGTGNTELSFKNLTALLAITVSADDFSEVNNIVVKSDKAMNGAFIVYLTENESQYSISSKTATDAQMTITLNCQNAGANTAIASGESKTFYVSIPPAIYGYLQIEVTDGTNTKTMKTKAASIEVKRNTIYEIAFADNQTPAADPNLLAGEFSVSATKKVKFTKGNLYCNASVSPATFAFETNQYDFPTNYSYPDDATTKLWTCTHVGHFFWNSYAEYTLTDATASPGKPHEFKPYFSAYGPKSKSASDEFWCGEAHPLEVAGTQGLYTLSADEWAYLLNPPYYEYTVGRTQTNRFARARVNNTYGYLIFPDGYNGETAVSGTGIGTVNEDGDSGYPSENIPDATWADMKAAGVVFLPNAGIRKGTEYTPGYGKYWSSTPDDNVLKAKNTYFDANGIVDCPGNTYRSDGSSIRLVKTVEAGQGGNED